jgi:SnoaL-like domain
VVAIDGAGATATASSYVSAPIIPIGPDGPGATFVVGASYHDRLVRTAEGWRIAERIERSRWMLGGPPTAPT